MGTINKIRIGSAYYDISPLSTTDKETLSFMQGYNYVDNRLIIPTNKHFVQCDTNAGGSLQFSGTMKVGQTMRIFLRNKTGNPFTIYLPRSQGGKNNVFLTDKKDILLNRWTLIEVTCYETNAYIIDYKQQIY